MRCLITSAASIRYLRHSSLLPSSYASASSSSNNLPAAHHSILYEDEQTLCVYKPAGVAIQGSVESPAYQRWLSLLQNAAPSPVYPVHRLDLVCIVVFDVDVTHAVASGRFRPSLTSEDT